MSTIRKKPAPSRPVSRTQGGRRTAFRAGKQEELKSLLRVQEENHRIMARKLHDTIGQNLAALQMNLFLMRDSGITLHPYLRPALTNSLALAQTCILETRNLSYALYPPLLEELGLPVALRACLIDYSQRTGMDLRLDLPARMGRLEQAVEITLFRMVQDALESVSPNSQGPSVLRIRKRPASVVLELSVPEIWSEGDLGIARIEMRAHQLGGKTTIEAGSDGSTLRVILPTNSQRARVASRS